MSPNRPRRYFRDVITDDDLARMIHAMNAPADEVYHRQVCEGPYYPCHGPGWSTKILAEVWRGTLPHHRPEIAPRIGLADWSAPGFENPLKPKP